MAAAATFALAALLAWSATAAGLLDINWVSFAPTDFDPTIGRYPTQESLREDLAVLRRAGFAGVITYGSENTLQHVPRLAREEGFQGVVMGVFDPTSEEEFTNAVSAREFVDAYGVGNEGLVIPGCSEGGYTRVQLEATLARLRSATGRPVATTEQIGDYFCDPTLLHVGDFVFPNAHPFWHGIQDPAAAAQWTADQYAALQALMAAQGIAKVLVFKEVGLPSAGCPGCSEAAQADYFERLQDLRHAGALLYSHFETYDQPWKDWHPVEPHWGLFRSDRTPKEVVGRITPRADVRINGEDGPVAVDEGEAVTVALSPQSLVGLDADWWVAATTPFGVYWFTLDSG
jgi:exo-beta-1,3-glucanase (GH17 family)